MYYSPTACPQMYYSLTAWLQMYPDNVPTDVLLTDSVSTDVLLHDSVPTDVLLTDSVPTDVGPAGGGAALGGADAVVVAGALSVAAQTVIGTAHRTLAGLEPDNVGLRGPAGSACGQTSLSSATWSSLTHTLSSLSSLFVTTQRLCVPVLYVLAQKPSTMTRNQRCRRAGYFVVTVDIVGIHRLIIIGERCDSLGEASTLKA